jgi:hypothetical protein
MEVNLMIGISLILLMKGNICCMKTEMLMQISGMVKSSKVTGIPLVILLGEWKGNMVY